MKRFMLDVSLKTRLLLRLLIVVGSFGVLLLIAFTHHLGRLQEAEVEDKSKLVLAGLTAVQAYVRTTLRPAMYDTLAPGAFALEAMSTSFVTRKVMSDLNMAKDQYSYRRVALDPRNPEFAANELEKGYIEFFQNNPDTASLTEFRDVDGERCHLTARAVVFEAGCLTCHGSPANAPAEMLAKYGSERGFGRRAGEIGGLDLLIMPVEREAVALKKASLDFLLVFSLGTALILASVHFFSDRILIGNIARLASLLRSRFPEEAGKTLSPPPGGADEIEAMMRSVERFADHLREAKLALADYAANLETKVARRTAELSDEAAARRADVQLFLDMLKIYEGGLDRQRLYGLALETLAGRFGARQASFHCFFSMGVYAWPPGSDDAPLTPARRGTILDGRIVAEPGLVAVPVKSGESVRGALMLRLGGDADLPPREAELLAAVGVQLGIAVENLEAMETLLGQKAILESIFEGIVDPLFLIGPQGEVVLANDSARGLLGEFAEAGVSPGVLLERTGAGQDATRERELRLPGGKTYGLRAYPLTALGGPGRTIVYARDNTVEKTMLARFQQSEKALAVGNLAAGLAHEINNPLGVILLYARLLSDGAAPDQAEDIDIIIRHTLQARKVLDDLMRFAHRKPGAAGSVNLAETAAFISRVFGVRAAKLGVAIHTDVPQGLPQIAGDTAALEQIISNLVINSLDALEESAGDGAGPGRIDIAAGSDGGGQVVLTIRDNGPGIPEPHLHRIFDPFFTTKDVGRGTGLGLSVVFGLVRDLGGRIEAENSGGAVFTIHLKEAAA